MEGYFDAAKFQLTLSIGCALLVLLIDIGVIVFNRFGPLLAVLAALLTILSIVFQWRSERLRGVAEALLRKFEMHKGLGWAISREEISDLLAMASKRIKNAAYSTGEDDYFASQHPQPAKKVLENLQESAWTTKHQAQRMARYTGRVSAAVFLLAFITLVVALQSALSHTTAQNIAQIVLAILVFVFSAGYVRLAFDYYMFASDAGKIEDQAVEMCKRRRVKDAEAIKLLHEYQVVRATSPLLPGWLWKMMQNELTELWKQRTIE